MKVFKKSFLAGFTLLALSCVLTACNTVHGAGHDIQAGGRAISRAAS